MNSLQLRRHAVIISSYFTNTFFCSLKTLEVSHAWNSLQKYVANKLELVCFEWKLFCICYVFILLTYIYMCVCMCVCIYVYICICIIYIYIYILYIYIYTVYKSKEQNKLLTTVYCKPTDRRNFLHYASAHPRSLIKSIPYNQVLHLKKVCTETSEVSKNVQVL